MTRPPRAREKHLAEEAKNNPEEYEKFWANFGIYLKEGVTSDFTHRDSIAKLLRFESSASEPGKLISLAEYVERMKDDQQEIYYINAPSREAAENGPYVEAFKKRELEIIYTLEPIDDFVMNHLGEFDGKKLVSADRGDLDLSAKTALIGGSFFSSVLFSKPSASTPSHLLLTLHPSLFTPHYCIFTSIRRAQTVLADTLTVALPTN